MHTIMIIREEGGYFAAAAATALPWQHLPNLDGRCKLTPTGRYAASRGNPRLQQAKWKLQPANGTCILLQRSWYNAICWVLEC
jgi:phage I-like protein